MIDLPDYRPPVATVEAGASVSVQEAPSQEARPLLAPASNTPNRGEWKHSTRVDEPDSTEERAPVAQTDPSSV
jgi:hypothetical protein